MRTVFWEDRKVKMIDQRLLPGEFVIAEFDTVERVAAGIREMYVRGAPAIGAAAAYGMALAAYRSPAGDRDSLLADLRRARCAEQQNAQRGHGHCHPRHEAVLLYEHREIGRSGAVRVFWAPS